MGENGQTWLQGAKALLPETVTLRRKIHEHPELGLHLPKTVAAVREALEGLDVRIETGPSTSGMIVTLQGPTQGRTVLLRGDMTRCRCRKTPTCRSNRRSRGGCMRAGMTRIPRCSRAR